MILYLNPSACQCTAMRRWKSIRREVLRLTGRLDEFVTGDTESLRSDVAERFNRGERRFIAAGGDGTVNALLNALFSMPPDRMSGEVKIGAVGLGSSNDFHKPLGGARFCGGYPVRVDFSTALPRDIVKASISDDVRTVARYFAVNGSIGVTAEGNRIFNDGHTAVRTLRRIDTSAAITCAALGAIRAHRDTEARISIDGLPPRNARISNLALMKSPHIAAGLRLSLDIGPDDGFMGVWIEENRSRLDLLRMLFSLARGSYRPGPGSQTGKCRSLIISSEDPFTIEYDGETIAGSHAEFTVLRRALGVCHR